MRWLSRHDEQINETISFTALFPYHRKGVKEQCQKKKETNCEKQDNNWSNRGLIILGTKGTGWHPVDCANCGEKDRNTPCKILKSYRLVRVGLCLFRLTDLTYFTTYSWWAFASSVLLKALRGTTTAKPHWAICLYACSSRTRKICTLSLHIVVTSPMTLWLYNGNKRHVISDVRSSDFFLLNRIQSVSTKETIQNGPLTRTKLSVRQKGNLFEKLAEESGR